MRSGIVGIKKCIIEALSTRNENKWIEVFYDFEKAFDSVSHIMLKKIMKSYRFPEQVRKIIENILDKAKIKLYQGREEICEIKIKSGVLQGDSLSPFLFVLTQDPLIKILTKMKIGHEIIGGFSTDISYFVDDLRVSSDKTTKIEKAHETTVE